jgi:hypothetical protein
VLTLSPTSPALFHVTSTQAIPAPLRQISTV